MAAAAAARKAGARPRRVAEATVAAEVGAAFLGASPMALTLAVAAGLAVPAGLASAAAAARYAGRARPAAGEAVRLVLAAELIAFWAYGADRPFWASLLFGWTLAALAAVDLETRRLPDPLTLPLIPLGLLVAWAQDPAALLWHALAAAVGGAVFYAVGEGYFRLRGRDGLGLGDAKLLAALGAWVGLAGLPGLIFLGALMAMLALVVEALLRGRALSGASAIAFGPYLALAGWLSWLYGPLLLS